jgi:PKD repeat protein
MNGFNNVVVLPADTTILWNGNAMSSTTSTAYTQGSDVTIGFSDTNIKNITYLILNKDTSSYSVKMYFNTSAMAQQAKDNWLTLGSGAPIIGLLESAIAYDVSATPLVYTYHLTAAGATEGVNSTVWSNIGITNGYGISGNNTANSLTVTSATLNTLNTGNYYVYAMGTDINNNIIAIDEKELTVSSTPPVPTPIPTSVPAPTVSGITPNTGQNTTSISITNLAGTEFTSSLGGTTVKLTKTGQTDIAATSVTVASATQITCTFDLTGKIAGQWNVVVTNPDGQTATLTNGFTITSVSIPAPTVTSITPISGQNTTSVSITNLAGTGFLTGATVKLTKTGQTDIAATGVTVVSATNITCTFDLTGKTIGPWNVVVTNTDTQTGTLPNGFSITSASIPAPTVTGITPSTGQNTTSISITNLAGTGFLTGATVKLTKTNQTDIAATSVTVVSATQINCTFDLTGKIAGQWNVVVTNTDTQIGTLPNGFTVTFGIPAPTVTGITPSSGQNTASISITNLAGTGFNSGATVKLTQGGQTDIVATGVTIVSSTQINCTIDLTGKIAGQWNVVVTNPDSQMGTLPNGFTITGITPPVANFIGTPDYGPDPLFVTFTDVSSGSPTSWLWEFGDGTRSTAQNPTHLYTSTQTRNWYTVSLTATNAGGNNTLTKSEYIGTIGYKPSAWFDYYPRSGSDPLTVTFTDTSRKSPTSWFWDFGDGNTSTERHPTHTFTTPDGNSKTYRVSLTATNAFGSDTYVTSVYVFDSWVRADFTVSPSFGTAPSLITFTDTSSGSVNPAHWGWNFGDGTTSDLQNPPPHSYPAAGNYRVRLNVYADRWYKNNEMQKTLTVYATTPVNATVAEFNPTQVTFGTPTIVFASGGTKNASCWYWDFGDGTTSTEPNPSHTYRVPGSYIITLRTTSGTSCSSTATTGHTEITATESTMTSNVTVYALPPQPDFTATPLFGGIPLNVTFTDTTTNSPTSWSWDFGDGSTSTVQNPSHIYREVGTYTVKLTATNAQGSANATRDSYINAYALAPETYFTGTPSTGSAPLAVAFTDSSMNGPTSWNWSFGDGTTSTVQNPVHTYASSGTYTVALNATNSLGSNLFTRTNYITVSSPTTTSTVGVFRSGVFYLRNSNSAGNADNSFAYGSATDVPVTGDWTGQGKDTAGVFRQGMFYLRNSNTAGNADNSFAYGAATDKPLVGHWTTGQTGDTVGVFRSGMFYLRNSNTAGNADTAFAYGAATDVPLVGDWTGQGYDTAGVFRNGMFYLRNSNSAGNADNSFAYGAATDIPVVWHHDGKDTVGIFRSGTFYLRNSNSAGNADTAFAYGASTDIPLDGKWI